MAGGGISGRASDRSRHHAAGLTPATPARKARREPKPPHRGTHEEPPNTPISPAEKRDLRRVAGLMVPASAEYGVPGADDPAIFADIVKSLGRDMADVREALAALARLAGGAFADCRPARAECRGLHARGGAAVAALGRVRRCKLLPR